MNLFTFFHFQNGTLCYRFLRFVLGWLCGSRMCEIVCNPMVSLYYMSICPHRWKLHTVCTHRSQWLAADYCVYIRFFFLSRFTFIKMFFMTHKYRVCFGIYETPLLYVILHLYPTYVQMLFVLWGHTAAIVLINDQQMLFLVNHSMLAPATLPTILEHHYSNTEFHFGECNLIIYPSFNLQPWLHTNWSSPYCCLKAALSTLH